MKCYFPWLHHVAHGNTTQLWDHYLVRLPTCGKTFAYMGSLPIQGSTPYIWNIFPYFGSLAPRQQPQQEELSNREHFVQVYISIYFVVLFISIYFYIQLLCTDDRQYNNSMFNKHKSKYANE